MMTKLSIRYYCVYATPNLWIYIGKWGFPGSSVGKESACSGERSSSSGSGISPGEEIGYPLQYSWASLVAQTVKYTYDLGDLGLILGLGRSPGEGNSYPLQYSGLENSMDRKCLAGSCPWGRKESDMTERLSFTSLHIGKWI